MHSFKILNKQIKNMIEGKITLNMSFLDCKNEIITLYAQANDICFIKPLFLEAKKIPKNLFDQIILSKDKINYDDFFEKYYNNFPKESPLNL